METENQREQLHLLKSMKRIKHCLVLISFGIPITFFGLCNSIHSLGNSIHCKQLYIEKRFLLKFATLMDTF